MPEKKFYVVDTNVLLDDPGVDGTPGAIEILPNGAQNEIHIPYHVILEMDKLKKDPLIGHIVSQAVESLHKNFRNIKILRLKNPYQPMHVAGCFEDMVDLYILEEIRQNFQNSPKPILVTNDRIFQLLASAEGVSWEEYKGSNPFRSKAELFTGIVNEKSTIRNSFIWDGQGKPVFRGWNKDKPLSYQNSSWKVIPRNLYQNMALDLMLNPDINIVSLQSQAGYGKSFLALASALDLVLKEKRHSKIYVVKPMIEIGNAMGYLPGSVEEKMAPYTHYIGHLIRKLHDLRPANRIFLEEKSNDKSNGKSVKSKSKSKSKDNDKVKTKDTEEYPKKYNPKYFEILPLQFVRGMNIEDAVVIIDEVQNMSRMECRALLSRMGENVKCFCLGDTNQVDNRYLNANNNGLNWIVKQFMGKKIYSHLVLKGTKSRGPITDLVIEAGL